jgi:hypothetical protein
MRLPDSNIWKIDGVPIPSPSSFSLQSEHLQSSGERTADGILHKETVRYNVVAGASFSYDVISQEQMQEILDLVSQEKEYFELTYFDFRKGIRTITCYSNSISAELYNAVLYNGLWTDLKFTCIER